MVGLKISLDAVALLTYNQSSEFVPENPLGRNVAAGSSVIGASLPMFATLVAVLCSTMPGPSYCIEESLAVLPSAVCAIQAQFTLAEWKEAGKYRDNWEIASFRCESPDYVVKGRI